MTPSRKVSASAIRETWARDASLPLRQELFVGAVGSTFRSAGWAYRPRRCSDALGSSPGEATHLIYIISRQLGWRSTIPLDQLRTSTERLFGYLSYYC